MFNTITVNIVDLNDIQNVVDHDFFTTLIDELNNSDISFGNNDDTLVKIPRFIELMNEALETYSCPWDDDEKPSEEKMEKVEKQVKAVIEGLNALPAGTVVALGS